MSRVHGYVATRGCILKKGLIDMLCNWQQCQVAIRAMYDSICRCCLKYTFLLLLIIKRNAYISALILGYSRIWMVYICNLQDDLQST